MRSILLSRGLFLLGGLFTAYVVECMERASAVEPTSVIRVEEDWVLQVTEPAPNTSSPQIGTQLTPDHTDGVNFAQFRMNFQESPEFVEGGMQIQLWEGAINTTERTAEHMNLSYANETLSWTQVMSVADNRLEFSVINGVSTSFGDFGGNSFRIRSVTNFEDLDGYDTAKSVEDSGITLGANRVQSLRLVQVRKTLANGAVVVDDAVRQVYPVTQSSE